jgi:thioredoxin-like negative regulator of GroEL
VLREETRLVLVEFEARWCEPCRRLRPQIERLARERADLCRVLSVDADAHPELVRRHAVEAFPTLVFFKGGEELHRFKGGALPPSALRFLRRSSDV